MKNRLKKIADYLKENPLIFIIVASFGLMAIAICYYLIIRWKYPMTERGLFGDTFGLLNALFSGLAFAGLIYTLVKQRDELKRNEYIVHKERFESTFFTLLELQDKITGCLTMVIYNLDRLNPEGLNAGWTITGKKVIEEELGMLKRQHLNQRLTDVKKLKDIYEAWDKNSLHKYDRYLTNLTNINEFIMNSTLTIPDKIFFMRVFALQLDESELAFFYYYYTLSENNRYAGGLEKATELDLIEFMRESYLSDKTHLELYYSKEYLLLHKIYDGSEHKNMPLSEL